MWGKKRKKGFLLLYFSIIFVLIGNIFIFFVFIPVGVEELCCDKCKMIFNDSLIIGLSVILLCKSGFLNCCKRRKMRRKKRIGNQNNDCTVIQLNKINEILKTD